MSQPVWHGMDTDAVLRHLDSSKEGLTTADAQKRLAEHGLNVIPEKRQSLSLPTFAYLIHIQPWIKYFLFILTNIVFTSRIADSLRRDLAVYLNKPGTSHEKNISTKCYKA